MARVYGKFSDLITFTRASGGTALRPIGYGSEVSFTLTKSGDNETNTVTLYSDGFDIDQVDSSSIVYATIRGTFEANKVYVLSGDYTSSSGSLKIDQSNIAGTAITVSGYIVFMPVEPVSAITIYRSTTPSAASLRNISIREVLFDQPNAPLTLFNHPVNVPRIEYDADGNRLGLLVEESRTNLIEYSDFRSTWASSNCTLTSSQQSPDGNTNAMLFKRSSTAASFLAKSTSKAASSLTYSLSVFVKKDTARYFAVRLQGLYPSRADVVFDLNSGSIATPAIKTLNFSSPSAYIENIGNGWYRCILTATSDAYTVITPLFSFNSNNVAIDGIDTAPDSSGIIFGAQLEQASFPTSYIPTSGSTATRAADVASIPVSEFGYNQDAGTVVVDYEPNGVKPNRRAFSINDGTSLEEIGWYSSTGDLHRTIVTSGGVVQAAIIGATALVSGTNYRSASAFKENDFAMSVDGQSVVTDTSGSVPTVSTLDIGHASYNASLTFNGHIKSIKYYPRRLTNSQLVEITS